MCTHCSDFAKLTRLSEPIPARSRVAIVTGASGGIGRAVAERLAADGVSVVAHYSGNAAAAEEVVSSTTAQGGQAISFGGDVADENAMAELFETVTTRFGGIDVVVHTAGIMPLSPIAEMDLDTFDRVQRVNVRYQPARGPSDTAPTRHPREPSKR